jgi:hypothetical protein
MAEHRRAELVVEALEMAVWQRKPTVGLVHIPTRAARADSSGPRNTSKMRSCDGRVEAASV